MAYYDQRSEPPPPRYAMLSEYQSGGDSLTLRPPPHRRNLPRYLSHSSDDGAACGCGCLCWCCLTLLLFLVVLAAAALYLFLAYNPKIPSYSVAGLSVASFRFFPSDLTLETKLVASVRAENPNDMIGISYGHGSTVVVAYRNTTLCSGHLPSFYQGHRNTTVMRVVMEGRNGYGSGLQKALEESQRNGHVPLDVFVHVPVKLRFGEVNFREVVVNVHCTLVVNSLSPGKKTEIKSAKYNVNVEF
ncbi:NDR1/HIN1-like protein 6 [Typha latifolia]|uniref:NDR1/HIN1-like protein 6 n=1 Tax=Typha latifolia TaxID=4733 RepID=UPI003C2DBD83